MKNLTRFFFYIFVTSTFFSCEPEEIIKQEKKVRIALEKIDPIGETGNEHDKRPAKDSIQ